MEDSEDQQGARGSHSHHVEAEAIVRNSPVLRGRGRTHLITDAQPGPGQDRRRREIEYVVLQGLRIPSLVAACFFLTLHWWVAAAVVIALTIPLPWIAVMLTR